jgi:hypothetical protein
MRRAVMAALLFGWLGAMPLSARQTVVSGTESNVTSNGQLCPVPEIVPASEPRTPQSDEAVPAEPVPWRTAWGLVDLRIIPAGPKTAPNGEEYHPNFCMDLDLNFWIWRSQRVYVFVDASFWGEKPEYGVTNGRDGDLGTSKREFDLSGGVAWNYAGSWEARAFGYSLNNLNRGSDPVTPSGFNDGFGLENRYYISPEYEKLGQTGFDVTRATFLSVGYYPSKNMVGNDGRVFTPGLFLRAYLTYDLCDWPCYAFVDSTYIAESSFQSKLLLFDVGLAARPFRCCRQCEFRLGSENTADFQVRDVQNLWYASVRFVF